MPRALFANSSTGGARPCKTNRANATRRRDAGLSLARGLIEFSSDTFAKREGVLRTGNKRAAIGTECFFIFKKFSLWRRDRGKRLRSFFFSFFFSNNEFEGDWSLIGATLIPYRYFRDLRCRTLKFRIQSFRFYAWPVRYDLYSMCSCTINASRYD